MRLRNIISVMSIGLIAWQTGAAAPEDDYPDFYTSVAWSIPAGMEASTVPTAYAPTANTNQRYTPYCVDATCTPDPSDTSMMKITRFKTAHANIRDFTADTIAGAADQRAAAKAIFYEVRDLVQLEDMGFLGAYGAWKYRAGNNVSKTSLLVAMARSAKIPARYVIREGTAAPNSLGYNAADSTALTDDSTLDPAVFGTQHVYAEVNINGEWIAADPTWNAGLAGAFDIARFGEALVSVDSKGGPNAGERADELPADFVASQPHPYLDGNIDPATYNEDKLQETAPPQLGYLYWRNATSPMNLFIKNVRYRSTVRDMESAANYGIAELQQYRDQTASGTADHKAATNSLDQLKQALKALGKGKTADALANFESAEAKVREVSTFYDNLDLQRIRYTLAGFTRENAEFALMKFQEANPETMNILERNDNLGLNWQVLYGFDSDHWIWDGTTYVEGTGPLDIELGCNDLDYVPGVWTCDPSLEQYILENLFIGFYASFGIPMKISTIDEDNYTVLFDPKNVFLNPMAPPPEVLVDGDGVQYDPAGADFDHTAYGVGAFMNTIPVYSIPGANGIPDFFEAASAGAFRMWRMTGGYEYQRERQTPDDMHNCNKLLDTYPDYSCRAIFAMDNQVARDTINRAADMGAQKIILDSGNLVAADFTDLGYGWEIGRYIAESSNPAMQLQIKGAQSTYPSMINSVVDFVAAELAKAEYTGKRVVVGLTSHGFPTTDIIEQGFGYPGCTDQWLPGSPYLCPFVSGVPYDYGADFPDDLRQPGFEIDEYWNPTGNMGLFNHPTGYVYGEDNWHANNHAFEDAAVAAIVARGIGPGSLFAQLDSNGNGVIQDDEIFVIQNDFSEQEYDPSDIWLGATEITGNGSINYQGPGNDCTGGRCYQVQGEYFASPAKLKEKIDAEGDHIDYFVDIPFLWGIESSESIHHRMTIFDAFRKGPMNMVWLDDKFRTEQVFEPSGMRFCGGMMGMGADENLCWGMGYDPITYVMTRMATEHDDGTRMAIQESFIDCVDDYAGCGRSINIPTP